MKNDRARRYAALPRLRPLAFALAFAFAADTAISQTTLPLPAATQAAGSTLVNTPARAVQPLDQVIPSTVVITREAIERADVTSVPELLRRVAGLEFTAFGGNGQPANVIARGASGDQVLVLVDGLRISDGGASAALIALGTGRNQRGSVSIENIPLGAIERIEIVKGAHSAVWGSGAEGAVVNIITRSTREGNLFEATAGVGNEQRTHASLHAAGQERDLKFALSLGASRSDSGSASNEKAPTYNADRDLHRNEFATLKLSHQMFNGDVVTLSAFHSRGRTDTDLGKSRRTGEMTDDRVERTLQGVKLTSTGYIRDYWRLRLELGQTLDKAEADGRVAAAIKTRLSQAALVNEVGIVGGKLIVGADATRERSDSNAVATSFDQRHYGVFGGLREKFGMHQIELDLRRDRDKDAELSSGERDGDREYVNTVRGAYAFTLPSVGQVYVSGGDGYRAPTTSERFGTIVDVTTNAPLLVANPDLKLEKSLSREVGYRRAGDNYRLNVALFEHRYKDTIRYVRGGASPVAPLVIVNGGNAKARGVEVTADYEWQGYRLATTLVTQRTKDEATGERLPGRANYFGTLSLAKELGPWSFAGWLTLTGDRTDTPIDGSSLRLGSYANLSGSVRYRLDDEWMLELVANNVGAKRIELIQGYEQAGSTVLLNVRYEAKR